MSGAPRISVLMPVFNAERYLDETIGSILGQTERDFEFIIIDDGSTDRSLNILRKYERADPRIRLISRANTGYALALNEGLGLARGDLIARMDADDVSHAERFKKQARFMDEHPEVLASSGSVELIDAAGRLLLVSRQPTSDDEIQAAALAGRTLIIHSAAIMRRQAVLAVGGYDADMTPSEDLDLWLRLGERGKLANLPDILGKYRLHTSSVCATESDKQKQNSRKASEEAWRRRGIVGEYEWTEPSRPQPNRGSRHEFLLKYGWWAFQSAQRSTALLYACRALIQRPWGVNAWRLLVCAALKPMSATVSSQ